MMSSRKGKITNGLLFLFAFLVSINLPGSGFPCDTWVAVRDATSDGSVILAKNSDRPPMEAQPLVHMPRANHSTGGDGEMHVYPNPSGSRDL